MPVAQKLVDVYRITEIDGGHEYPIQSSAEMKTLQSFPCRFRLWCSPTILRGGYPMPCRGKGPGYLSKRGIRLRQRKLHSHQPLRRSIHLIEKYKFKTSSNTNKVKNKRGPFPNLTKHFLIFLKFGSALFNSNSISGFNFLSISFFCKKCGQSFARAVKLWTTFCKHLFVLS